MVQVIQPIPFFIDTPLLICDWCRIYKIPDGKPENTFAFSGEAKNKKYATEIIHECHESWRRLITGESPAKTPVYDISMHVPSIYARVLHL